MISKSNKINTVICSSGARYAFWKQRGMIIASEQYFSWRSLICLIIIYKSINSFRVRLRSALDCHAVEINV